LGGESPHNAYRGTHNEKKGGFGSGFPDLIAPIPEPDSGIPGRDHFSVAWSRPGKFSRRREFRRWMSPSLIFQIIKISPVWQTGLILLYSRNPGFFASPKIRGIQRKRYNNVISGPVSCPD